MNKVICPACGASDVKKEVVKETAQLTLGPQFDFEQTVYTCNVCDEQGDFQQINDDKYLEAHKIASVHSVQLMINHLTEKYGITMAFFERAFELPIRTVTRWKNGDFSAGSLAFLRTVSTYPWLTEVAANKFRPDVARSVLVREACSTFVQAVETVQGSSKRVHLEDDGRSYTLQAELVLPYQNEPTPTITMSSGNKMMAVGG